MDEQGNYGRWVKPLRDKKDLRGNLEEVLSPEKKISARKINKRTCIIHYQLINPLK